MVEVDFPTTKGDKLRTPVLAAGGIVLRRGKDPLFAVVRMRKRNDWVLPKGKLDHGETPRQAAEREVLEETGHVVVVHEFIGTLAYDSGGRSKVVHFWRMEAEPRQTLPLMKDIRAVDWLPLDEALQRLSRSYEQAFLTEIGPLVLKSAGHFVSATPTAPPPPRCPTSPLPTGDEIITDLAEAPSLALEQPSDAIEPGPPLSMLQRLRRWLRGTTRS
ncbi:NUDIX hydrolase [Rhodopseudomonas sp. BR0G17]|uniref:NUDIX hydrolase n=1 Tax=Rhodopseudomonas sp. BR0G17 TaxID=2269368 RepID=UPI0013E01676|nr:NUDIX hydrolase [Rhodopseudomonas sp. BR0G17]NEW97771.1 NUDIX hydrolase [Rhodopseudomonas sp. BR0G17]